MKTKKEVFYNVTIIALAVTAVLGSLSSFSYSFAAAAAVSAAAATTVVTTVADAAADTH